MSSNLTASATHAAYALWSGGGSFYVLPYSDPSVSNAFALVPVLPRRQFFAARRAELAQWIHRCVVDDLVDVDERLVGREVGFDDHTNDDVGLFDDPRRRKDAHATDQRIQIDQVGDLRRVVLVRVGIPARCLLDEPAVELFLPVLVERCCAVNCTRWPSHDDAIMVTPPIVEPASAASADMNAGSMI